MRKIIWTLSFLCALCVLCTCAVFSADGTARDITAAVTVTAVGFENGQLMTDGAASSPAVCGAGGRVTLNARENIGALYVKFHTAPDSWTVSGDGGEITCGGSGFFHEYVDVSAQIGESAIVTLSFAHGAEISEIIVLSEGERPADVQVWQPPCDEAELLLFSAHSDDDHLYFAGLIPYYTARGYDVQVAYLTNHPYNPVRRHEALDGLWEAGCRYYPIFGEFADFRLDDYDQTVAEYARLGTSYEMLESFAVSAIRRTKPLVVVTHDVDGEYGHGMHLVLSDVVQSAVGKSGESAYPASIEEYGAWTVLKTYIHLYGQGKIVLPIDAPLAYFGGRSAFQVSQDAFRYHKSQHWMMFYEWLYGEWDEITKSSQIRDYNPAYYGLYASEVGADAAGCDMFENLEMHLARRGIGVMGEELARTEEEISALREENAALSEAVSALESAMAEAEETVAELRAALLAERAEKADADADRSAEEIASLRSENQRMRTAVTVLGGALALFVIVTAILAVYRKKK